MPIVSRFYGIVIKMYFFQSEHNPPHVHVIYDNQYIGVIDIRTQKMIEGDLPSRALTMVQEWVKRHEAELLSIWETQRFVKLPPLE